MQTLYARICDYRNLELAFRKARKGKSRKAYVMAFEASLEMNLLLLRDELENHTYAPEPLESFILRDPKTRTISSSDFRDRVVHHALCNIIEQLFDKSFIFDSYANRIGKGALKAVERLEHFTRKESLNNSRACFVLKADIRKYFDTVDQGILREILKTHINDERVMWLCQVILGNFETMNGKGMPLGNLTSQFFANVYLNELDQFVKHVLKERFYVRYVDDFVIVGRDVAHLYGVKRRIDCFLKERLALELHPLKSRIVKFERGVDFLGFRVFPWFRLLRKKNCWRMKEKWRNLKDDYVLKRVSVDAMYICVQGWTAYASNATTFKMRRRLIEEFDTLRGADLSTIELNRLLGLTVAK